MLFKSNCSMNHDLHYNHYFQERNNFCREHTMEDWAFMSLMQHIFYIHFDCNTQTNDCFTFNSIELFFRRHVLIMVIDNQHQVFKMPLASAVSSMTMDLWLLVVFWKEMPKLTNQVSTNHDNSRHMYHTHTLETFHFTWLKSIHVMQMVQTKKLCKRHNMMNEGLVKMKIMMHDCDTP